jgi:TRAP transporter 4TM/12TM fusion protein
MAISDSGVSRLLAGIEAGRTYRHVVAVIAVAMALYHMYAIAWAPPEAMTFRAIHLSFALTLVFAYYPSGQDGRRVLFFRAVDLAMVALSLFATGYILFSHDYIVNRVLYIDDPTPSDVAFGILLVVMVLEATRRVIGWTLPLTALVFLVYVFGFTDVAPLVVLDQLYLTTEGIFGSTLGVSASYVLIFVVFGAFMERTGTGQLFMDFALSLTGHTAGGPGKVSVVSSSLFGTISGSAVANVMVDGPITIPLMKRTGFRPHFAAAVEAVASTGGQIMPPIMGAAAFVMAEFLQVSYLQVTAWAAIPAILYYISCFGAVHFEAKRHGLVGVPRKELPRLGQVLADRGHLFVPVLVILAGMFMSYSAPLCALAGCLFCFPMALLRAKTREDITWPSVWHALEDGAKNCLSVAMACATAGIIIGIISLTGAGISFTQVVVDLSQNNLVLALILTMVAGIVLGMGMPTTPAYIIMVSLLVPAITKIQIEPGVFVPVPAAHMFAFYFAILSAITPPVALAVFAAAALARSNLWQTGIAAMKVGAAAFIVPFMFVYEPALLTIGPWSEILSASITAIIGVLLLAAGLHGYFFGPALWFERILLCVAALLLIKPGWETDLLGLTLTAMAVASQLVRQRWQRSPADHR